MSQIPGLPVHRVLYNDLFKDGLMVFLNVFIEGLFIMLAERLFHNFVVAKKKEVEVLFSLVLRM